MDQETRVALADLGDRLDAGFARVNRYLELAHVQHLELDTRFDRFESDVGGRLDRLDFEVQSLRNELLTHRNWSAAGFADVRSELRTLRSEIASQHRESDGRVDRLRTELDELTGRVDRLEEARRLPGD